MVVPKVIGDEVDGLLNEGAHVLDRGCLAGDLRGCLQLSALAGQLSGALRYLLLERGLMGL